MEILNRFASFDIEVACDVKHATKADKCYYNFIGMEISTEAEELITAFNKKHEAMGVTVNSYTFCEFLGNIKTDHTTRSQWLSQLRMRYNATKEHLDSMPWIA
jgi:hypothetical protein